MKTAGRALRLISAAGVFGMLFLLDTPVVTASSTNPLAALTGAPSENLCIDCHASFPLNSGPGALTIQAPASYVPNQVYRITVRVQQPGQSRWGFQVTALNTANESAGTLVVTDTLRTRTQQAPFLGRTYINHTAQGTYANVQSGPVDWSFNWVAPHANIGPITFYASANAANQNSNPDGDYIYTSTRLVQPQGGGDTLTFRTFRTDDLLAKKLEKRVRVATGWTATFRNTTGSLVSSLEIRFKKPVTLTVYNPFPDAFVFDEGKTWIVSGQMLVDGDSVTVSGIGPKDVTEIVSWRFGDAETGPLLPGFIPPAQKHLLPMPNSANLRTEVFQYGGFRAGTPQTDGAAGLTLGKAFMRYRNFKWRVDSDSAKVHGWVRITKPGNFYKTLVATRGGATHTGLPRGLCAFDNGRLFLRQQGSLPPTKMNNRLVAELAALKMNIAASALGITPPGLGELIYDVEGHPLDERMIRDIAVITDSLLTYCGTTEPEQYEMLDGVLRAINGAFYGPLDTVSFADSLVFTGVRSVSEVPFLRANFDVPPARISRTLDPEFEEEADEDEEFATESAVPEVIQVAQNYPNPFNPSTSIQFELNEYAYVTVRVYSLLGQEVGLLAQNEMMFDGTNEVMFDARQLSSGVYIYRISAQSVEDPGRHMELSGKMLLLK